MMQRTAPPPHSDFLADRHPYMPEDNEANFASTVDPHQVCVAFLARGVPKLTELLAFKELSTESRVEALKTLKSQLSNQVLKSDAIAKDAIEFCAALLEDESPLVRQRAGDVIAALALIRNGQFAVLYAGAVPILTTCLADESAGVRLSASKALRHLSDSRVGAEILVELNEPIGKLVLALSDQPRLSIVLNVVAALANATRYFPGVEQVLDAAGVAPLVSTLLGEQVAGLRKSTLKTLWNVSNHPLGKSAAIKAGAVPAIAGFLLQQGSLDVRRCASGALSAIAVDEEGKAAILGSSRCIDGLCALLLTGDGVRRSADPTVQFSTADGGGGGGETKGSGGGGGGERKVSYRYQFGGGCKEGTHDNVVRNARSAVRLASDNGDAQRVFTRRLVADAAVLHDVFGVQCCGPLNGLLDDDSAEAKKLAAAALLGAIQMEGGVAKAMSCLYIIEKLARLLGSDNSMETAQSAYLCLRRLCRSAPPARVRLQRFVLADTEEAANLKRSLARFPDLGQLVMKDK